MSALLCEVAAPAGDMEHGLVVSWVQGRGILSSSVGGITLMLLQAGGGLLSSPVTLRGGGDYSHPPSDFSFLAGPPPP